MNSAGTAMYVVLQEKLSVSREGAVVERGLFQPHVDEPPEEEIVVELIAEERSLHTV